MITDDRIQLLEKLNRIELLSKSSKIGRLIADPFRYLYATTYAHLLYPILKRGQLVHFKTFFESEMQAYLPAGTDIYLLGAKSHDSEIRLTRFLIHQLKDGDIFFDIGSHYGFFSLLASKLVGFKGKVHAFEASKKNFQLLKNNCQSVNHIQTHHCAITDKDQTVTFYEFPLMHSENNTLDTSVFKQENWYQNQRAVPIEVQGISLASFCETMSIQPSIIKIDVEGAELQVIRGMLELFKQKISPIIIMEFWMNPKTNQGQSQAIALMREFGYNSYLIDHTGTISSIADLNQLYLKKNMESDNLVFSKERL